MPHTSARNEMAQATTLVLAGPGDARGSNGDGSTVADGSAPGKYRWVAINRGYKLGTETIKDKVLDRCRIRHHNDENMMQYDARTGLDGMYNIGLVRSPLSRFLSGYKVSLAQERLGFKKLIAQGRKQNDIFF